MAVLTDQALVYAACEPLGVFSSVGGVGQQVPATRGPEIGLNERESLMKLYVDANGKQVTVTKDPTEKLEQNGRQKTERNTGRPMWSTQVFVLDDDGGEVITVTTAGEKPNVKVGQVVAVSKLEALPWATNGRNGVAFRAEEIKAAGGLSSVKTG
jgi:hypothetical protein